MKNVLLCLPRLRFVTVLLFAGLILQFQNGHAAGVVSGTPTAGPVNLNAKAFDLSKTKLTMAQIRQIPDDAQITVPGGHTVSARRYKKIADAIQKIQARSLKLDPANAFSRAEGAPQAQITKGADIAALAKRKDSDVLQLPDGRKITVRDLKKLSEVYKQIHGQPLTAISSGSPKRPNLEGKAIMVATAEDIQKLEKMPDSTIVENPKGKRATLGELRTFAKEHGKPVGVGR